MPNKEPANAYTTAYEHLASTPLAGDHEFRSAVARQIVDTLVKLRSERGLAWLKKIGNGPTYYNCVVDASLEFGPNADLMTGRIAMEDAYVATVKTFVAAFGRPGA